MLDHEDSKEAATNLYAADHPPPPHTIVQIHKSDEQCCPFSSFSLHVNQANPSRPLFGLYPKVQLRGKDVEQTKE